jgi:hypothetical protein
MSNSLRIFELTVVIIGALLQHVSARDRIAFPDVRPFRSLRWWFPWPEPGEFRTRRGYRIEQVGRLLFWTFTFLVLFGLLRDSLLPGAH